MDFLTKYSEINILNGNFSQFFKEENLFQVNKIGNFTNIFVNNSLIEDPEESQINKILINSKTIDKTSQNLISAHLIQFQTLFELSFMVNNFITYFISSYQNLMTL